MKRIIKFRVWDKKNKRWLKSYKNEGNHFSYHSQTDEEMDETGSWTIAALLKDEDVEVQQFTGLIDGKGKEVYESDILESPNDQEVQELMKKDDVTFWERSIVRYYTELARFGLEFYSPFGGEGYTGRDQHIDLYIKNGNVVIGNENEHEQLLTCSKEYPRALSSGRAP